MKWQLLDEFNFDSQGSNITPTFQEAEIKLLLIKTHFAKLNVRKTREIMKMAVVRVSSERSPRRWRQQASLNVDNYQKA
jgi:hypothetical protein